MSLIHNKRLHFLMERFAVVPFGFGCASQSSVNLGEESRSKKSKIKAASSNPPSLDERRPTDNGRSITEGRSGINNSSFHFLSQGKRQISSGMQRLIRSIKSFSQIFVYKEDVDEDLEREMEIGFPTDVKHVTHIGLDGSTTTNNGRLAAASNNPNNNASSPPQVLSFPSISLKQFELAMAAQTNQTS